MTKEQILIGYRILRDIENAEEVKKCVPRIGEVVLYLGAGSASERLAEIRPSKISSFYSNRFAGKPPEEILRLWEDELKIFLERIAYQVDQVIYQKNRELQDLGVVRSEIPIEFIKDDGDDPPIK